eukprot:CAMPEP_0202961150 /NCGR_PEP_ID=MMETSP1396-20130829/5211_1 /ASSEMBLY_ACC=CAM_ASM_000872 /TAXON_ID= /ORGANISM="Pseudokeronopsis sp., Strain Brazil" /LENGTH=58 /DNA_ID=CAMNT_0049680763 /DNA_START=398 /DNA_END=574 /DNA_ORIENTATION=+
MYEPGSSQAELKPAGEAIAYPLVLEEEEKKMEQPILKVEQSLDVSDNKIVQRGGEMEL